MDLSFDYSGQIPRDVDILNPQVQALVGLTHLSQDLLFNSVNPLSSGNSYPTMLAGFDPSYNADMTVTLAAGRIYTLADVLQNAFSDYNSGNPDTRQVLQQGQADIQTLTFAAAPSTSGYSRIDLVEVSFSETDADYIAVQYYNSATPSQPLNGPGGSGTTQPLTRIKAANVSVVTGTAAASPVAPSPSAGAVGMYYVTVAYGQTSITSADVSLATGGAPFITGSQTGQQSANLIPSNTDTYNIGSSSFEWLDLYAKNPTFSGTFLETNTTDSTSPTTGSAQFSGGVGIAKSLWVGSVFNTAGVATFADTTDATSSTVGGTIVSGGLAVAKALIVGTTGTFGGSVTLSAVSGQSLTIDSTQASTSDTTGALVVAGGAGIGGALNVGGALAATEEVSSSIGFGFTALRSQPASSSTQGIFGNSTTNSIDFIGTSWAFVPASSTTYTPVATISNSGTLTATSGTFSRSVVNGINLTYVFNPHNSSSGDGAGVAFGVNSTNGLLYRLWTNVNNGVTYYDSDSTFDQVFRVSTGANFGSATPIEALRLNGSTGNATFAGALTAAGLSLTGSPNVTSAVSALTLHSTGTGGVAWEIVSTANSTGNAVGNGALAFFDGTAYLLNLTSSGLIPNTSGGLTLGTASLPFGAAYMGALTATSANFQTAGTATVLAGDSTDDNAIYIQASVNGSVIQSTNYAGNATKTLSIQPSGGSTTIAGQAVVGSGNAVYSQQNTLGLQLAYDASTTGWTAQSGVIVTKDASNNPLATAIQATTLTIASGQTNFVGTGGTGVSPVSMGTLTATSLTTGTGSAASNQTITTNALSYYEEGTVSLTSQSGVFTAVETITATYVRVGNRVSLYFSAFSYTMGTTTEVITLDGLPASLQPAHAQVFIVPVQSGGATPQAGQLQVNGSSIYLASSINNGTFAGSSSGNGLSAPTSVTYILNQ